MGTLGHKSWDARTLRFSSPPHVLIVEARFYEAVNDLLLQGAAAALSEIGATFETLTVPGALEIPAAVQFAARRLPSAGKPFDAFVAVGCVVRGATSHYDTVCFESARGLSEVVLRNDLCAGNAILTVETMEQAMERADPVRLNKGGEAAKAALVMLSIKQSCGVRSSGGGA